MPTPVRSSRASPLRGAHPGLPGQQRRGGGGGSHQARAPRHQAAVPGELPGRLPRPHLRRHQPDRVQGQVPRGLRSPAAGRVPRAVRPRRGPALVRRGAVRSPRARRRGGRDHRGAHPGRGRLHRAGARVPGGPPPDLRCHGILLIADEIQSGAGRTGQMWAIDHEGVVPDILLTAKGIASGMPLGAIIAEAAIMETWGPGAHGRTYGGNPVACAAALATIDLLSGGLMRMPRRAASGAGRAAGAPGAHPGLVARRAGPGPDAGRRVRHGRARGGGPVGLLRARAAGAGVRQLSGAHVAAAGGHDAPRCQRAAGLRRGGRGRRGARCHR